MASKLLEDWCAGAVGYVPPEAPENAIRGFGENVNSFCWFDRKKCKVPQLLGFLRRFGVDILHVLETQMNVDCKQWKHRYGKLTDRVGVGREKRCIAAGNMHVDDRACPGGTAQMVFGSLSSFVLDQSADLTGLGRWVWTLVGMEGGKKTRFITAYQPCDNRTGPNTVWRQHANYFEAQGLHVNPRTLFVQHLLELIAEAKEQGEEVILYIDANDHVYNGRLAKALASDEFNMTEQFFSVTGQ